MRDETRPASGGPMEVFVRILAIVFIVELLVMGMLDRLGAHDAGRWAVVDASLLALISAPLLYAGVVRPVAGRLLGRAEEALRRSEADFTRLFNGVSDLIFVMRVEDGGVVRCLTVNRAYHSVTGLTEDQVIGKKVEEILPPQTARCVTEKCREVIRAGRSIKYEEEMEMPAGRVIVETTLTPVFDAAGRCTHLLGIARDVTARKRLESELRYLADHDALTGLPNRHRFERELSRHIDAARRDHGSGAVLLLDLDNFRYVNDSLGHRAGNEILASLAGVLRQSLRDSDFLARLGGDEFAVILPGADAVRAQAVAERILGRIRHRSIVVAGQPLDLTASIGIALFPAHGLAADEVIAAADTAMYRAKEAGRNRLSLYAPEDGWRSQMQAKLVWVTRIREALEKDRFLLYLQPILDLRRNRVVQYEVLLRMAGDDGEVVPPSAFLDVAEQFGLIRDIDLLVVQRAIRLLGDLRRAGSGLSLDVNLSAKSFSDPRFLDLIRRETAASAVDPGHLIFEITETAAVTNLEDAQRFIQGLKSLGCRFGLDDFGVGFSSFNYLKHLPVDYLKIDGAFVRNLPQSPVDRHVVKAMVQVAQGLGKETVAEFVGDAETLRLVREMGVDYAQGYCVGKPRPAGEVIPEVINA